MICYTGTVQSTQMSFNAFAVYTFFTKPRIPFDTLALASPVARSITFMLKITRDRSNVSMSAWAAILSRLITVAEGSWGKI